MEYKFLLNTLTLFNKSTAFSTTDVYDLFMDYVRMKSGDTLFPLRNITMKRLSGDLDRLYRMGLLKRKRITRTIRLKSSMPHNRGFQYLYQVSKQGWQYSTYLRNHEEDSGGMSTDEPMRANMTDLMHQLLPPGLADFVEEHVFPDHYDYRGRHNRFPRKKYDELLRSLRRCNDQLRGKERENSWLRKILTDSGYRFRSQ